MNLKQLAYLVALHETSSFTLAAKQSGVSQSTLSGGIAALESTLNTTLVERDKQNVLFTPLGQGVVTRAIALLAASKDLHTFVASSNTPMQGTIVLGAIPSIAPFLLTPLILKAKQQYPALRVLIREAQSAQLLTMLREGQIDMALIATPYDTNGFTVQHLFNEPLMLIAAADDALADIAKPTLAHLDAERLILLQEGHCLREHTLQSCNQQERSSAAIEASSLPTLVQMVAAGLGVALLPEMAVNSSLLSPYLVNKQLVAHTFAKPSPQRGVALIARSTHTKHQELEALGRLAKSVHTL